VAKISRKRIIFFAVYLIVTTIVSALILEGAVRLLGAAPQINTAYAHYVADPYVSFKPRPFMVTSGQMLGEYTFEWKHNSEGFRDVEHAVDKPAGTFRILGLGDSFTQGMGAAFEETYLYRLESMLNARQGSHPAVEIIKTGVSGYFPEPERLLLQHYGLKYSPDLILVGFVPNDVLDTYLGLNWFRVAMLGCLQTREANRLGPKALWLYLHSHVCRIVLRRFVASRIAKDQPMVFPDVFRPNGFHEKDWRQVENEFDKMIELARGANAQIAFVHIPLQPPWGNPAAYPGERIAKWCAERNVVSIDTFPALREALSNRTLYWEKDGHCNPEGYKVIAETIYSALLEKKLVP